MVGRKTQLRSYRPSKRLDILKHWIQLRLDLFPTKPPTTHTQHQLYEPKGTSHNMPQPLNRPKTYKDYKDQSTAYYPHLMTAHKANTGARPPTYSNY